MTNEERREVARRLRENAEAHPDMSLVLNVAFADEGLRPEGMKEWKVTSHDAAMRLADLIDPGEDVSMSAYDLLPEEDREILWWVHSFDGGLDAVSRRYREADYRRIELCSTLGIDTETGWSDAMAEMTRRLMPGGVEWPRFEDGEPVRIGDDFEDLGQVAGIKFGAGGVTIEGTAGNSDLFITSGERVKRPAVPAADGEPLEVGQTVWDENGAEYVVCEVGPQSVTVEYWNEGIAAHGSIAPSKLTHIKPEPPDTWERIEADCSKADVEYCDKYGLLDPSCNADEGEAAERHCIDCGCTCGEKMARDLVRRCKALAERGE